MTAQHTQMLPQIESLANNIAQVCTDLNNILAAGTQFDREADPTSIAQARATMEALQGALNCLPSLETGLLTFEAQLSRQDDSQKEPLAFRSRLVGRLQSTMFTYQTRTELAESIESSGTRPTSEEISSSVKLCNKIQQTLDTTRVQRLDLLRDRAKLRRLHNRWLDPHPISQLPPELLSHVFLLVDDARPDFKQRPSDPDSLDLTPRIFQKGILPAPVTLSHVSADWRAAALDTPLLWNWIDVRGSRAELRRVDTWLARSGRLPLHLHVTLDRPNSPSDIAKTIIPHLQRVKDIQIIIKSLKGIEFLSRLAKASDPNTGAYQLRVLKVHSNQSLDAPEIDSLHLQSHDVDQDLDNAPLTHFVGRHPSLRQLTLDLSFDQNLPEFLESFPYSPSLETLTLVAVSGDLALTRVRSAEQNLPSLRFLQLHRTYVSLWLLKSFMLGTRQPLSLHLGDCRVRVPIENYPQYQNWTPVRQNPNFLSPLVEADMKTLTRDPDVTLTWSKINLELERRDFIVR